MAHAKLRDLADEMFEQMKQSDQLELQARAFSHLPQPVLTPNHTYQRLVHDEVEQVPLEAMANRVVASGVVPYPAGYSIAHAWRECRICRWYVSQLSTSFASVGSAFSWFRA